LSILAELIEEYNVNSIAIGNGTASRETEQLVADLLRELKKEDLGYIIVNEAGASVYSASPLAKKEFPQLEASMRGNISIARRLLDPLAELVKINPKHIGVGQYQHDVNQKNLNQELRNVVEDCVNSVGVNLNTASPALLRYVSGLSSRTASNIVKYREENTKFENRKELKEVTGIGVKTFQQAAGFLRIPDSQNPLDNTFIHPESYHVTENLLDKFDIQDVELGGRLIDEKLKNNDISINRLAEELEAGKPTLEDIIKNLKKPGLDPRDHLPKPILSQKVLSIDDLQEGMVLKGTVRNVVDFGAFVDIGVKQDGLVHISELANEFVKDPTEIVSVGDVVDVEVLSIDQTRGRIGLSMKKIKKK
ncbi:MAG: helix-hairpin-helix domain-containing protein, partial [Candidatus Marinimicrobia bacterium]|nr:helix-hairpin-helix domain-containing protein [Candidatus Neomarinimicrobiota bacterium]